MHVARSILVACVALALAGRVAPAQQFAPRGVTRSSLRVATVRGDTADVPEQHSQTFHVVRGAAVGGAIGVVVGVTTASVMIMLSPGTNHYSEDGLTYGLLALLGGSLGVVFGAIVGSLSAQ